MAPLPPCGPPRSPPPRRLLLLLLLVLSATLLGAQARAEPAAGNAVPAQSRPCVDCHAFEFMQRALQDLRKTAYSLDARPLSQPILLGPEVQLECRPLCLAGSCTQPLAWKASGEQSFGEKAGCCVTDSRVPEILSALGPFLRHSMNGPVLGPPPPHSGVWAGVSLCSEDPYYPRRGPMGLW
ncbi:hypothetical protein JEQ12_017683 [Ovis aries]|uniref:NELL2-interacting cell ontogeny regulator 1 n=1 Tax=Ovis aries TaxID=9940 RepID=A0A836D109_SHEEP|nr:hypothetical protein JEQ12_017683 [Ovis aries]